MARNKLNSGKDSGKTSGSGTGNKQTDNNTNTGTGTEKETGTGAGTETGKGDVGQDSGLPILEHGTPILDLPEIVNDKPVMNMTIPVPASLPKKSHHKKAETKPAQNDTTAENLGMLLMTGFTIISIRAGDHWKLDENEVKAITEPMARIINRLIPAASSSKYTDYALLALGLTMVITPRVMMSMELSKGGKKDEREIKNISPKANVNVDGGEQTGFNDSTVKNVLSYTNQEG